MFDHLIEQSYEQNLDGVRGWLLLLCLILCVISPALYLITIFYNPSPFLIVGAVVMGSYGFVAGYKLWRIRAGAVKFARRFLVVNISVNACIVLAVAIFVSPVAASGDMGTIVWSTLWLQYLQRSARVTRTFREKPQDEGGHASSTNPPVLTNQPQPGGTHFLKTMVILAVLLASAFGCLMLIRPLTRYKYLKMRDVPYRYDRYSGRTDKLAYGGWVPVGFDRLPIAIPTNAVSLQYDSFASHDLASTGEQICFDVTNDSGYMIKSVTIGVSEKPFFHFDELVTLENGTLLRSGTQDCLCGISHATDWTWHFKVQSAKGWKP
jgi:hypothetical protein